MKINQLVELQRDGNFKVSKDSNMIEANIGGTVLTSAMCDNIAKTLGWSARRSLPGWKLIDKTNTYTKAFGKYLDNRFNNFNVLFENIRISDAEKTMDRVVIYNDKSGLAHESYTLIHGMQGLGGSYAIFDAKKSETHPIVASRTLKDVLEFLNTYTQMM